MNSSDKVRMLVYKRVLMMLKLAVIGLLFVEGTTHKKQVRIILVNFPMG